MIATESPRSISSETSRNAGTVRSPIRNVLTRCSTSIMFGLLFIVQRLNRVHVSSLASRIEPERHAYQGREKKSHHHGSRAHHGRPVREPGNQNACRNPE